MSPTSLTLAELRKSGWTCAVVERWNAWARRRIDVFGGDILACKPGISGPLLIQCTTGPNAAARMTKVKALPAVKAWLSGGGHFEVWSWRKAGPRGGRKVWTVTRRPVALEDLSENASQVGET